MKRALCILLASLLAGAGCYAVYFHFATRNTARMERAPDAEMEWLRHEFALTDAQFARVKALHEAYQSKCDVMCAKIIESNARLEEIMAAPAGKVTPEMKAALAEVSAADLECRQGMLEHIYAVSREMDPAQGARYRRMMETSVLQTKPHHQHIMPVDAR